jgi:hypothetical protein
MPRAEHPQSHLARAPADGESAQRFDFELARAPKLFLHRLTSPRRERAFYRVQLAQRSSDEFALLIV